jgi:hypothetical protein
LVSSINGDPLLYLAAQLFGIPQHRTLGLGETTAMLQLRLALIVVTPPSISPRR